MYNKEAKEISLRTVFSSFPLIHRQVPMVSKSRHPHAPPIPPESPPTSPFPLPETPFPSVAPRDFKIKFTRLSMARRPFDI